MRLRSALRTRVPPLRRTVWVGTKRPPTIVAVGRATTLDDISTALWMPGGNVGSIFTADAAVLEPGTADISFTIVVRLNTYKPIMAYANKWDDATNQRGWQFFSDDRVPKFSFSADGVTPVYVTGDNPIPTDDGKMVAFKMTVVQTGGDKVVTWYQQDATAATAQAVAADHATGWSSFSTGSVASTASIFGTTVPFYLGVFDDFKGLIHAASLKIGASKVFELPELTTLAEGVTSFAETINSATVTVSGTAKLQRYTPRIIKTVHEIQATETDEAQHFLNFGAPINLIATAVSSSEIDLTWNAVTGVTSYDIERDGMVIAEYVGTNSYADTGLSSGTNYVYRVRSVVCG